MNVENRKLFTNRDARAKLATMGGIMASSPELLGTVQKFSNGQEVKIPNTDTETTNNIISKYLEAVESYPKPQDMSQEVYDQRIKDYLIYELVMTREYDADGNQIPKEMTPEERAYGERAVNEALSDISPYSKMQGLANDYITGQQGNEDRALYDRLNRLAFVRDELPQDVPQSVVDSLSGRTFRDDDQAAAVAQEFVAMPEVDTQFSANLSNIAPNMYGPYGLAPFPSPQVNERSGILSSESMMNEQAPRPTVSSLEAPSISGMPLVEPSGPAPDRTRTLGDIVAENPRTPERDAVLDKIKQRFANMFSSGNQDASDSGIMAKALEEIAARDPEAMARIKAGTSISSRVKDIVEPVAEQASLMNVAADSGPESGMFYDDVKAGFNILPPAPYLSEAEQLLQQETGPVISGPFANVPRNYGTGIEAAQLNATEAGYVPSPVTSGEELLAVTNTLPENPRFKNVSTDDLLSLVNEGDAAATTEMQRRMNQINEADVTDPDKNDPRRFGGVDPSFQDGSKYTPKKQSKTSSASPIASSIAESELVADFKDVFVGGDQIVITPNVLTKYNLTEEDISLDTLVTKRELENLSETVNKEEVLERAVSATAEQPVQEFRDQEAALVESQGGLNSMRLEDTKDIRAQRAAKFADEEVNRQGPNIVFDPAKIQEEIDKGGRGSNSIIGGITGTNQNLTPKESVKAYQAMYKEMLGMDDEDEEKEKWHQMAMIGFAIAAGQDPNALSNIAGGLLEGTKMARKDRMRKKDREDKFTMMAIQAADADRRAAIAAGATVDAANLAFNRRLEELDIRQDAAIVTAANLAKTQKERDKVKADAVLEAARLERANTSFLASDRGKQMAKIFSTNPTQLSDKDKLAEMSGTFSKDAMDRFRSAMSIVGTGVTGDGAEEITLNSF